MSPEQAHRDGLEIENPIASIDGDRHVGHREIMRQDLTAGERPRKGQVLQGLRGFRERERQAADVQIAAPGFEPLTGLFIRVRNSRVRDGHFRKVQGRERPLGLGRSWDIELSAAVPFDGNPDPVQREGFDPDLLSEQRQELDSQVDFSR